MSGIQVKFVGVKINYDIRSDLPDHLKFSRVATESEYLKYVEKYEKDKTGGWGFHECLNFSIPEDEHLRFYVPPTSIPDKKYWDEEFVFFSFTYKSDPVLPSHIVGVHACARMISGDGIMREDINGQPGDKSLTFHAVANPAFSTLLVPPLKYERKAGIYTRVYSQWGNKLRYLDEAYAKRIVDDALRKAREEVRTSNLARKGILKREIDVLERVADRYFSKRSEKRKSPRPLPPDRELGSLGEEVIWKREVNYAKKNKIELSNIEWVSRADPQSEFDVKTVRKTAGGIVDHYLEVKSTTIEDGSNVYISDRQIDFLSKHQNCSSIVLVFFDHTRKVKGIRYMSYKELLEEYDFHAIKFRFVPKTRN